MRRAGLDYHEFASISVHRDWSSCRSALAETATGRWFAATTKATQFASNLGYRPGDVFVFGRETAGLPADVLLEFPDAQRIRVPMQPNSRSLNLSNAVAVVVYEAWRQQGFAGAV
jgi:tRNA (cytidine/uridine-2'-O-)-methyltransferase